MPATNAISALGERVFFDQYWRRHPLLLRGCWPQPPQFLTPEELASLATEPDVVSRIVMGDTAAEEWMLIDGPVTETFFSDTPDTDWQLTVDELDRHIPVFARIRDAFRFLADWRFDAVAASYAAPGGTAGRQEDDADVFLLQVTGETEWTVAATTPGESLPQSADGRDTPVLQSRLSPGDLLYIPPGYQHFGIATQESIIYRIRFRDPPVGELLRAWATDQAQAMTTAVPVPTTSSNPAELPQSLIQELRNKLREALDTPDGALDDWLASHLTRTHGAPEPLMSSLEPTGAAVHEALTSGRQLIVNPVIRLGLLEQPGQPPRIFINGQEQTPPSAVAPVLQRLGRWRQLAMADLTESQAASDAVLAWLAEGLSRGWFLFDDELEAADSETGY